MKPNILVFFSDQQRWDTANETVMPNLMRLAREGVRFTNSYTCQPVCGPARACLQTGLYATQNGCFWNGVALPRDIKPIAAYFNEAGYETAYVGKWHLGSDRLPNVGVHCERTAVPKDRQGCYRDWWRAADVLEFTSHGYDGYVFNGDGRRIDFKGYRADCITDFALEYLERKTSDKPFFLFVSPLEPHHQNDRRRYEGPRELVPKFRDYPIPDDLSFLPGDYGQMYPDYLAAIASLDANVGRLTEYLKAKGLYENTVIVYTSDHGSHFKTRNAEYKRSCHDSAVRTPLVIRGGPFKAGEVDDRLVSLIDLPPTLLDLAGIEIPPGFMGSSLLRRMSGEKERDCVFIQISESQCGRAIRTKKYKYSVRAPTPTGYALRGSPLYFEDYLYDLERDPAEKYNLVKDGAYAAARGRLRGLLTREMVNAGEKKPLILPAFKVRKK